MAKKKKGDGLQPVSLTRYSGYDGGWKTAEDCFDWVCREMPSQPYFFALVLLRVLKASVCPWTISGSGRIQKAAMDMVGRIASDAGFMSCYSGTLCGEAYINTTWGNADGIWTVEKVRLLPPTMFERRLPDYEKIFFRSIYGIGEIDPGYVFYSQYMPTFHIFGHSGNPGGLLSMVNQLWKALEIQKETINHALNLLKSSYDPGGVGTIPDRATKDDQGAFLDAIQKSAGRMVIPFGYTWEPIDPKIGGVAEVINSVMDRMEKFITIAVMGSTLTTDTGRNGNYATATVHTQTAENITAYDMGYIERVVQSILNEFFRTNWPEKAPALIREHRFSMSQAEIEDLQAVSEIYERLYSMGLPFGIPDLREKFDIPEPAGEVLKKQADAAAESIDAGEDRLRFYERLMKDETR